METNRCEMNCACYLQIQQEVYLSKCMFSLSSLVLQFNQSRMGLIQRSGTQKHSIHKIKCNVSKYHYLCLKSTWQHVNGLNNTILDKFIQIQTILAIGNTAYITIMAIFININFFQRMTAKEIHKCCNKTIQPCISKYCHYIASCPDSTCLMHQIISYLTNFNQFIVAWHKT